MSNTIQLIYHDLQFNIGEGEKLFSDQNIQKLQNNYNSIAIIGCQSSGKSTLLNRLFKTDFQEMDSENGRNQTTQGLWLSVASDVSTIIIDCEGTDSKERGENRLQFENCSSLFCLALSDVLLMNMWTQDVGRYTASNYNVLKMVFEMNLKLFQQSCAKKIVVILRDYNAQICKKEKFEQLIMKDINTLWADIKKPEQFKDSSPATFFQFEFITLPHKIYEEVNFNKEVDEIRKRFDTRHEKYFFDHTKGSKGVPVDGYIKYCESVWDTIIHEKDLNIPSQKEMLAIYRCNEIKEEAYNTVRKELVDFKNKSATSRISKFSELVLGMYNKCINYYDSIAKNYLQKVYEETRNSLHLNLIHELYIAFTNQINRILPVALKFFSKDLESELQKGSNFFQTVTQVKAEHLEKLKKNIAEIRVFDDWEISISEFEEQFDNAIDAAKKSCLEKLSKEIEESLKLQIDEILSERLDGDIDVNFWLNFNQEYCTLIYNKLFAFKNTLFEYYKLDNIVIENCLKELEINIRKAVTRNIEKKTKELSNFALDYFKKIFHYDNNKLPRKWDRLQENEIDEIYSKSIKQTEILFVLFSQIKLINNPLKDIFGYDFNIEFDEEKILSTIKTNLSTHIFKANIEKSEMVNMKNRFEANTLQIYEDAKRRNINFAPGGMPIWGWLLIAYTGYDDIFRIITSYMFIPILLIICTFVFAQSSPYLRPLNSLIYMLQDMILRPFKKKFV